MKSNASINLKNSSIFLPTGKSLIVQCLTTYFGSIKNEPLNATPSSSNNTPYSLEIVFLKSDNNGTFNVPSKPPFALGVSHHALCEK